MVVFSIIQLGFTRFLTDRKERISPPLRYMCVWWPAGGTRHRGECARLLAAILYFGHRKNDAPTPYMSIGSVRLGIAWTECKTGVTTLAND